MQAEVLGLAPHIDDTILVNHPVDDELYKVCLLIQLGLSLDVILNLLHDSNVYIFHLPHSCLPLYSYVSVA